MVFNLLTDVLLKNTFLSLIWIGLNLNRKLRVPYGNRWRSLYIKRIAGLVEILFSRTTFLKMFLETAPSIVAQPRSVFLT